MDISCGTSHPGWNVPRTSADAPPYQSPEEKRICSYSQLIFREAPISYDIPILPQLIERRRLLLSLISQSQQVATPPTAAFPIQQPRYIAQRIAPQQLIPQQPQPPVNPFITSVPQMHLTLPVISSSASIPIPQPVHTQQFQLYRPTPVVPAPMTRTETPIDVECSPSPQDRPISRKRKVSAEEASAAVSAVGGSNQHLFEISEKNFTESFAKKSASPANSPSSTTSSSANDRPSIEMIMSLNRSLTNLKNMLSQQGISVNTDSNGMPVDYSARPIDEIFKQARVQLDHQRKFTNDKEKSPWH